MSANPPSARLIIDHSWHSFPTTYEVQREDAALGTIMGGQKKAYAWPGGEATELTMGRLKIQVTIPPGCFRTLKLKKNWLGMPVAEIELSEPAAITEETLAPEERRLEKPETAPSAETEPAVTAEPVVVRQLHRFLAEQRVSHCTHCATIQTPPVALCPGCQKAPEETTGFLRVLIERVALIGLLVLLMYAAIIAGAVRGEKFEPAMLILPVVAVPMVLFCLNFLGFPVSFTRLFERGHVPAWAEKVFSWKRLAVEGWFAIVAWLIFAAVSLGNYLPLLFEKKA